MPDKVPAGTKGMICHVGFGGEDPRTGDYYTFLETMAGRLRRPHPLRRPRCGADQRAEHPRTRRWRRPSSTTPVRILRYSLIPDSEGPGRFRGGLGLCREYVFPDHEPDLHHPRRPRPVPSLGAVRRRGRTPGALPHHHGRRGGGDPFQGDGSGRERHRHPASRPVAEAATGRPGSAIRSGFSGTCSRRRSAPSAPSEVYGVVIDASGGSVDVAGTDERRRALRVQANPS